MKKRICLVLSLLVLLSAVTAYALSCDEPLQKADGYVAAGDDEKALAVKSNPEIAGGEKEKAAAPGPDPVQIQLDAAFSSGNPVLSETGSAAIRPQVSDFEISEEAKAALKESFGLDDPDAAIAAALGETEFTLLSESPAGNSGIISAGGSSAITVYNGKYHLPYPSAKGVPDEYTNLARVLSYFYSGFRSLIGEEGIVYSPDGRYAAFCNKRFTLMNMNLFLDPVLLDLSSGELILTATYPNKPAKDENAGAVSSAVFSSDSKYFYYVLFGKSGGARIRLYRYALDTGETELCFESEKDLYDPHLAELENGSLLMLDDCFRQGETEGLVVASCTDGTWSLEETKLKLDRDYCYAGRLIYSPNAGLVCLLERTGSDSSVTFQLISPNQGFEGIDRFWCVRKGTDELVALSPEEFRASFDTDVKSPLYPYQTLLNTVFSPDGNYILLHTVNNAVNGRSRNLFLVRLEDMSLLKVSGLEAEKILVGPLGMNYPMNIEWNTDELIIGTDDGIKTFVFTAR